MRPHVEERARATEINASLSSKFVSTSMQIHLPGDLATRFRRRLRREERSSREADFLFEAGITGGSLSGSSISLSLD